MIQSILNDEIEYIVDKNIEENDLGKSVSVFEMQLFEIDVCLTVGEINDLYKQKNILFTPVYLIINDNKCEKIGYFEFYSTEIATYMDKDGDLDISLIEGPVIFDYVDSDYLIGLLKKSNFLQQFKLADAELSDEIKKDMEEKIKERQRGKAVENIEEINKIELLITEFDGEFNGNIDKKLKKIYKKQVKESVITESSKWIQKHYKNNKYDIIDNEGGGDCLFSTIRDSLEDININLSVQSLRNVLSNAMTQENYETYKENFDLLNKEIMNIKDELSSLKNESKDLKLQYSDLTKKAKLYKSENERDKLLEAVNKRKEIKSQNDKLKEKSKNLMKQNQNALINFQDFKFMKDINNLQKLKVIVKQSNFWADSNAISKLEKMLNVKVIVLLKKNYQDGNKSLISCGDMVSKDITDKGSFKPKYYIIVSFMERNEGDHYVLVTYKKKRIFTFYEIPYAIREDIKEKCLSKDDKKRTLFDYIGLFNKYSKE
uniref:OTU domain-containing protein n=1 Tax=viral metagenome TaxID=1070528 RepID=A0A6C0FE14_9ZZZZ|tara:strand:+ start:8999 stop:10462 length:1464 start_codon:yes stop_codon:yes gene_type:complete